MSSTHEIEQTDTLIDTHGVRTPVSVVENITPKGLGPGAVYKRFRAGAKAVCLCQDARVQQLWDALVQDVGEGSQFWNESIFALARNHIAGQTDLGDVLRFAPGQWGHLARKIAFFPDAQTGRLRTFPDYPDHAQRPNAIKEDILQLAWDLALEVQQSALPVEMDASAYAVTIELLKYPDSGEDLQKIFELIGDSASRWTRLGQRVDSARALACGPFDRKIVRDLFGWMSLIPGLGGCLGTINAMFGKNPLYKLSGDEMIVGPAHTDGSRCLSMLAGERDVMRTEVYDGVSWIEVPVKATTLSILPGDMFDRRLGVPPTLHRYTIKRVRPAASQSNQNLTLLLGVSPRKLITKLA